MKFGGIAAPTYLVKNTKY